MSTRCSPVATVAAIAAGATLSSRDGNYSNSGCVGGCLRRRIAAFAAIAAISTIAAWVRGGPAGSAVAALSTGIWGVGMRSVIRVAHRDGLGVGYAARRAGLAVSSARPVDASSSVDAVRTSDCHGDGVGGAHQHTKNNQHPGCVETGQQTQLTPRRDAVHGLSLLGGRTGSVLIFNGKPQDALV
jgi:hypothetical protein